MATRTRLTLTLSAVIAVIGVAEGTPRPDPGPLVVIDATGKEQKLKSWKFTTGIRHLSWLAPAPAAPPAATSDEGKESKARPRREPVGPEALEFREENSTPFVEGVLTFILLDRIRSLDYDIEQKTVIARVAAGAKPEDDAVLTGTTRFDRVNKLAIEAEVDKGDLGVAEIRFAGGTARGVHGVRFPAPKVIKELPGRPAVITTAGKDPSPHKVVDLQALYRQSNGHERVLPLLMFKKSLKVDMAKIQKITSAGPDDEQGAWQVQLKGGGEETLTLLRVIPLDGGDAQLEGLVGRVPGGYKLFPVLTIGELVFDAVEEKSDSKTEK